MNNSIPNFIMGNNSHNNYSNNSNVSPSPTTISPIEIVVDAKTLVAQTQDRMLKALEGNYLYDSSLKDSQDFLFNHVNSKMSLVIMYADYMTYIFQKQILA
jgi:hypothetical protein